MMNKDEVAELILTLTETWRTMTDRQAICGDCHRVYTKYGLTARTKKELRNEGPCYCRCDD